MKSSPSSSDKRTSSEDSDLARFASLEVPVVRLSPEQSVKFAEEMLNPPEPTVEQRQRAADYWEWIKNVDRE
jgi:hypothetical protein